MHFLEIKKPGDTVENEKLRNWIDFFVSEGKEGEEKMKILLKDDQDIKKAHEAYKYFNSDEQLREIYNSRQKFLNDYYSYMDEAHDEGYEEGREEGIAELIITMYQNGADIEQIITLTGITRDKVEDIIKSH